MPLPGQTPSSPNDDEGVRVIRKPGRRPARAWMVAGSGLVAAISLAVGLRLASTAPPVSPIAMPASEAAPSALTGSTVGVRAAVEAGRSRDALPPSWETIPAPVQAPAPSDDPDDLASYFKPGDPEPAMADVIRALNEAGIRTGIGAFNPPGTSPPLGGLAVPPEFALPEGYVRHHQVTDDGEPIEAILMFAPDVVLRDAEGRLLPMPTDRVVTPEYAPPGLPLRRVDPPGT